ncbi:unnamed protein product [Toxocara canis]|uniref:Pecanex-like protein n=1 Tax=Toxocara canis TaxID=6265 RepID=A0A183VFI8_TOXCA|nr:unnamed protein product [Toxocara canis]
MTVGTHAAEIARQGIWASLTGGWYYEPAYSVFCNVVHLYIWILLFLLPLLLGVICTEANSLGLVLAYGGFIMLLFAVLKFAVSYLHNLFDTTDPIPRAPKKPSKLTGGESSLSTSLRQMSSSVRSRDGGEIEMVEMNVVRANDESVETASNEDHRSSSRRRRIVRIDEVVGPLVEGETRSHKVSAKLSATNEWCLGEGIRGQGFQRISSSSTCCGGSIECVYAEVQKHEKVTEIFVSCRPVNG